MLVTEGDALNKLVFIVTGRAIMTGENIAGDDPREYYEKLESPWDVCGHPKTQPVPNNPSSLSSSPHCSSLQPRTLHTSTS